MQTLAVPGEDSTLKMQSKEPGTVLHARNASPREAEAGGSRVGGRYEQQSKLMRKRKQKEVMSKVLV